MRRRRGGVAAPPPRVVVGGPSSAALARRLARRLRAPYIGASARVFSDGESRLTLRRAIPRGSTAIVVESTHPPVDTNLVRALTLVSAAASAAGRAVAVIPYLGYARQDRAFLSGELVTIREVARLLEGAGASGLVSVDIHSEEARAHFGIPAVSVPAAPALAAHFASVRMRDRVVVSPDAGGAQRAGLLARALGCGLAVLEKRRDRRTGETAVATREAPGVSGRDAILVDDMISTGGSISGAAAFLRSHGCARVHAACTHALLAGGARQRMRRAGISSVVATNTVPGPVSAVDVSGLLAAALGAPAR